MSDRRVAKGVLSKLAPGHSLYIRPIELIYGESASALVAGGEALHLAGGPSAFSKVELIWRHSTQPVERQIVRLDDLQDTIAGTDIPHAADAASQLLSLSHARPPFADISLRHPRIMGVVNTTPDSFSERGLYASASAAIDHGKRLWHAGADIIDIGGVSTRPGADTVSTEDELDRVIPVIEGLRDLPVPMSIDTRSKIVMTRAVAAGATVINDTSALTADADSLNFASNLDAPVVLMHCLGNPKSMQDAPRYADVSCDIYDYLAKRIAACRTGGIDAAQIVVDPGIGFGKTVQHNVEILRNLTLFHGLGVGLLIGVSRKSFIGALSKGAPTDNRVAGSLAAALWALHQGAQIVRAHDVGDTSQAIAVWEALATKVRA